MRQACAGACRLSADFDLALTEPLGGDAMERPPHGLMHGVLAGVALRSLASCMRKSTPVARVTTVMRGVGSHVAPEPAIARHILRAALPRKPVMSTLKSRRIIGFSFAVVVACALLGCGKRAEPPTTGAAASAPVAALARPYVVGTDAAYAPFESQNEKGEIVGFDIDVVRAIASQAGIEVKFVNTPWEGIFNALAQGDRDLLVSSITITDERRQSMDFSEPYFDAYQLIAVRGDSKVARFDDLKALKVGVQTGTTGDEAISKLQGKTSPNIRRFESTPLALKELEAGGVDAVVADNGVVVHHVVNNAGAKFKTVSDTAFAPERYGIAVKKGNAALLAQLNRGLAEIKANGSYERIRAQYLGAAPALAAPAPSASASPASPASAAK